MLGSNLNLLAPLIGSLGLPTLVILVALTAVNPVRYAMVVVRKACYETVPELIGDPDFVLALAVSAAWLTLTTATAVYVASRRPKGTPASAGRR